MRKTQQHGRNCPESRVLWHPELCLVHPVHTYNQCVGMSISAKFIETPLYAPVYVLCVQMFSVDFDGAKFCLQ